jgi:GNAT superfamily N-acetyltransferase
MPSPGKAAHQHRLVDARKVHGPRPAGPPLAGLAGRRSVGINGTRLSAVLGEEVIGHIEVETLQGAERLSRHGGWVDIGNLHVTGQHRRRGVATWLLGQAAGWLRLAQAERLLTYAWLEGQDPTGQDYAGYRAFLAASGFGELTRTKRGWTRTLQSCQRSRRSSIAPAHPTRHHDRSIRCGLS